MEKTIIGDEQAVKTVPEETSYRSDETPLNAVGADWLRDVRSLQRDKELFDLENQQKAIKESFSSAQHRCREIAQTLKECRGMLAERTGAGHAFVEQLSSGTFAALEQSQCRLFESLRGLECCFERNLVYSKELWRELAHARYLSLIDDFTGLPNRRAFLEKLDEEMGRARRYDAQFVLALIDLDLFKAVNDVYGHAAGDKVLYDYANRVLSEIRHHDIVARYGGEEFAVLFPETDLDGAFKALMNLRERAATIHCDVGGDGPIPIPTFSAGLTVYLPGEPREELIGRADKALYRAKALGRDRIEVGTAPIGQTLESKSA